MIRLGGPPFRWASFTPVAITDNSRTVVWSSEYYPFGEQYAEYVSETNKIRFPGQWHDQESGLHYNWHRYYHPSFGRYLQADPKGLAGGMNSYTYVRENPLNRSDPYGLDPWEDIKGTVIYPVHDFLNTGFGHGVANFWIGVGDVGSLGFTSWIRSQEWYGGDTYTDKCSGAYKAGEWTGLVAGSFVGTGIGARISSARAALVSELGSARTGLEFSHFVPVRYFKRFGLTRYAGKSIWNGNYVTRYTHSMHDPFRFALEGILKDDKWSLPVRLWSRTPLPFKSMIYGIGYGTLGMNLND